MSTNNGKIDPKFQEALNYLETMTRGKINKTEQYHNDKSSLLAITDLQELIEEHQKNLTYISTLEKILKETDKALGSACEIIAKCKCFKGCPFEENCNNVDCFDENVWKDYFMGAEDD